MTILETRTPHPTFAGFRSQPQRLKLCKKSHQKAGSACKKSYTELFWLKTPGQACELCQPVPAPVVIEAEEPTLILQEFPETETYPSATPSPEESQDFID